MFNQKIGNVTFFKLKWFVNLSDYMWIILFFSVIFENQVSIDYPETFLGVVRIVFLQKHIPISLFLIVFSKQKKS